MCVRLTKRPRLVLILALLVLNLGVAYFIMSYKKKRTVLVPIEWNGAGDVYPGCYVMLLAREKSDKGLGKYKLVVSGARIVAIKETGPTSAEALIEIFSHEVGAVISSSKHGPMSIVLTPYYAPSFWERLERLILG